MNTQSILPMALGPMEMTILPHLGAREHGSNENTNGLLRQYLPKGTDLAGLTQPQCNRLAEILNNRPRKRLGYRTPNEVYYSRPVVALQS